jgi:hypothetical protein
VGSEVVETLSGVAAGVLDGMEEPMVSDKDLMALLPDASVTLNPKVEVPVFAGVPKRVPFVDQLRPVLQEPEQEVIDHL